MAADAAMVADAYLQHLTDIDLGLLLGGTEHDRQGGDRLRARPAAVIRSRPGLLDDLLVRRRVAEAVFSPDGAGPFLGPSPFLVFAVAVHTAAVELGAAHHVTEWMGPRRRLPILDPGDLRDFLADPWRRLFLVELLASYTHVASGSVIVSTGRGWRRQRFSELDPVRMAALLDVVPDAERPGIYRRLGDLALFLTGVFPDHTAGHGFGPLDEIRLRRAGRDRAGGRGGGGAVERLQSGGDAVALLEELGRRWYRVAHQSLPVPAPAGLHVLGELVDRFGQARRVLNVVTDRTLFPYRDRWFGIAGG